MNQGGHVLSGVQKTTRIRIYETLAVKLDDRKPLARNRSSRDGPYKEYRRKQNVHWLKLWTAEINVSATLLDRQDSQNQ